MSYKEHENEALKLSSMGFAVVTISDTRTKENDESGEIIMKSVEDTNNKTEYYNIVKDDIKDVKDEIKKLLSFNKIQIIITNGSTGIGSRDIAVEAIKPLLEKELPGFGELFRMLSYQEIGSASMLSRAFAGVANKKLIFCLPGSKKAVKLAIEKLILPQAKHLIWSLQR
ncbi:MAG: MogA/MoaB family molybdenum cofactor biosynthesis protein [Candidatus Thermoplasmatota archaeon]|nr:MogA/MoaB family molybdenum cofactor biosynthesis protein [Candidatus Thermoplasmatota archaeon]MDI6855407.1 MogA/MoaB family molybdenum cofactor biosynthesis protein [Candidatus Thermoplasmatota archaeon]